jgi:flagellar basal-body rod protein FlgG
MYDSINIAVSGMQAQQSKIDVISNNLANVNTSGYKKSNVHFEDLMSKEVQASKSLFTREQQSSYAGMGTAISNIEREFTQGDIDITDGQLDVAIQGQGFLEILLPDGVSAFTRSGNLKVAADGYLVNRDGYALRPSIRIPENVESLLIQADGNIFAKLGEQDQPEFLGQIELANFMNAAALQPIGDNLYLQTEAAGAAYYSRPGEDGFGLLQQGAIERSNVNLVEEMTGLLMAQRGYELNAQVIQATNSILEVVNGLSR